MKLLLLSDKESEYLWDYYRPGRLKDIDLILSCGDLSSKYLTFLVTMAGRPLLYVHGNHDKTYDQHPPAIACCKGHLCKQGHEYLFSIKMPPLISFLLLST